ncbi:hypothetical protein XENTR_v10015902 [Xenopus tropicalis]|uniref:Poly(A) RNA polymerase, mitochondrial n=1 Tax=Xenopus tropicalis TaxID=8364 RepID=A0A8J0QX45_XENTR|nr:poly(A) RNA polymerase, mitochondrial [Xenopus tropicalis]KAE8595890.1 hypothetical protein XENTR_v10015902 [Xenopus tropicalis]|eukprot:XP_002940378.2 PREDICTED: poly(A) RNA polymerase, mitochondrial [Xenopus tropicalis]
MAWFGLIRPPYSDTARMRSPALSPAVMVACMKLRSVVRVTGRALSNAVGGQQQVAAAAGGGLCLDEDPVTRRTFAEVQKERQEQAKHTVLINCPPNVNENKFLKYLSQHGQITRHFFYEGYGAHAVVEFLDRESIESLRSATSLPTVENECILPFKSRLFTLKSDSALGNVPVPCHRQTALPINELIQKLCKAQNIEEQAYALLEEYQLTDENIRLRFLVSSLIKDIATAYFPEATVNPYGSTVNSFGKLGCDLDLFLDLDDIQKRIAVKTTGPFATEYLIKRVPSARVATQRILSVIGECIDNFGPGCTGVQKILNARCPLVRFSHQPAGLQCDLTSDNRIALRSSELLYIYGCFDHRLRALVFTLRCWARVHGITSAIPGAWITNFSLTMMILFFLQKRSPPVIPTLDHLKGLAGKEDKHIIDGHDCSFVSNLNRIKPSQNSEALDVLLGEFFEFYGNFDFSKNCIDIRKGKEQNKPEVCPLYIRNPFEQTLNVSKNVNQSQLDRFVALARESAWIMQEQISQSVHKENTAWGLGTLLLPSVFQGIGKIKKKRKRGPASDRIKSLLDSLKTNGKAR